MSGTVSSGPLALVQGLTLMRPPVVKGQKYPHERFLAFFRLVDASIVGHRQRVLT